MGIPGFGFGYLGDGRALSLQGLEFIFDDVLASWDPGGARKTFVEPLVCAWCCKVSDDEVTVPAFEKRGGSKAWCRNTGACSCVVLSLSTPGEAAWCKCYAQDPT